MGFYHYGMNGRVGWHREGAEKDGVNHFSLQF